MKCTLKFPGYSAADLNVNTDYSITEHTQTKNNEEIIWPKINMRKKWKMAAG
jgi:hypothetical protein